MHTLTHTYNTIALTRRVRINITVRMNNAKLIITEFQINKQIKRRIKVATAPASKCVDDACLTRLAR